MVLEVLKVLLILVVLLHHEDQVLLSCLHFLRDLVDLWVQPFQVVREVRLVL